MAYKRSRRDRLEAYVILDFEINPKIYSFRLCERILERASARRMETLLLGKFLCIFTIAESFLGRYFEGSL